VKKVDWSTLVPTIIGGVIAGGSTLTTIWVKQWIDNKRNLQEWFETQYIEKGVDKVLFNYFLLIAQMDLYIFRLRPKFNLLCDKLETRHAEPLGIITTLLDCFLLWNYNDVIISKIDNAIQQEDQELFRYPYDKINDMIEILSELRNLLLRVRLCKKSDVYNIKDRDDVKQYLKKLMGMGITTFNH
jgi:hypothetical protein